MSDIDTELGYASVDQLRALLDAGEVTAEEIVTSSLERIDRLNPSLTAVISVRAENAVADARAADQLPAADRGPLHGIPFTVKDTTETLDLPTTYGSAAFSGHQTNFEALIVSRLKAAGAVLVGKTNTPEFACEPMTRNEIFGDTHNPWATDRTPGGSSGGAAAGLAAGLFTLAQGTDCGGSIRIPASCCGVVGLKPTRGRVPLAPAAYEAWAGCLHSGPLARTVRDAALMLDAMSGPVLGEPYTIAIDPAGCASACDRSPRGTLRIAYSNAASGGTVDEEVAASFADALEVFRSLGADLVETAPDTSGLGPPFLTIANTAFAGMGAGMSDEQLAQLGPEPLSLMTRGWQIGAAEYYVAVQEAQRESARILQFWNDHDFLLTPTIPIVPPHLENFPSTQEFDAKWSEYGFFETFTFPANVTGQPALSLPCRRWSRIEIPIGVQLIGKHGAEAEMFALAAAYEAAALTTERRPDPVSLPAAARSLAAHGGSENTRFGGTH